MNNRGVLGLRTVGFAHRDLPVDANGGILRRASVAALLVGTTACGMPGARGPGAPGPSVPVTAAQLANAPIVVEPGERRLDARVGGTGCPAFTTSSPIATLDLREAVPALKVKGSTGFVLRTGDQMWPACDGTFDAAALKPGRYDVYPAVDCMKYTYAPVPGRPPGSTETQEVCQESLTPKIWVYANTQAMPGDARQVVKLDSLEKPRFVELTLANDRVVPPNEMAGRGCQDVAYTLEPDVLLDLPEPRQHVTIRVLPTTKPVRLRAQTDKGERSCRDEARIKHVVSPNMSDAGHPSYETDGDVELSGDAEGKVALWVGSKDPGETTKVTLMITDATTKLDPTARFDGGFPLDTVERRWLGAIFPQASLTPVFAHDPYHRRFVAAAQMYAATPNEAFVYAKRDVPAEGSEPALAKDEALAVIAFNGGGGLTVLTADGLIAHVKANAYTLTPPSTVVFPATPRPAVGDVFSLLPPEHVKDGEAYHAKFNAQDECRDRAYAPYAAQLPKVMPGYEIAMKSPAYVRIENAGHAAQDKKCGTREDLETKLAPERAKLQKFVDAERARLLELAVAPHRK